MQGMGSTEVAKKDQCVGVTSQYAKVPGTRCTLSVSDKALEDGLDLCFMHWQGTLQEGDPRKKVVAGPGRPRIERPSEALQRMVEDRVEEVIQVFFDAIEAEDVTLVKDADGNMEIVNTPNHALRMRAADSLLDRAFGKAVQRSESKNVNIGIEARSEKELEDLANAMRAARELEPADDEEIIEGTVRDT